jgi:hypothetical protein
MAEAMLIGIVPRFMKVIHIQLADKRGEVVVLEVLRKDLLCKLVRLLGYEAVPIFTPTDNVVAGWVLHNR